MNKIKRHKELCDLMHTTYENKNHDYGDSFGRSIAEHGYIAGVVRMEDKMNRVRSVIKNGEAHIKDESLCDTLLDLANYAIMLSMEVEKEWGKTYSEKTENCEETEELYGRRAFEKAVDLYVQKSNLFYGYSIKYNTLYTQLTLYGANDNGVYSKSYALCSIWENEETDVDYYITYLSFMLVK